MRTKFMAKSMMIAIVAASALAVSSFAIADFNTSNDAKIASYVMGYNTGYYYNGVNSSESIKTDAFDNGLKDGLAKKKPIYTPKEMDMAMIALQKAVQKNIAELTRQLAVNNLKTSNEYLEKVAKMNGVETLQKGLYYKVDTKGTGDTPTATDFVTINYTAALPDGKVVQDTFATKRPETFQVNKAILGWQQALKHMPQGSIWTVYVAPSLAFGEHAPLAIGPNQALTYKIQLVAVKQGA